MSPYAGRKRSQTKLIFKIQTVGVIWFKLYLQFKKKKKKYSRKHNLDTELQGHAKLDSQED